MSEPRVEEVHDAFVALEEEAGFWDLEAYGRAYWHEVRFSAYNAVLNALGLTKPAHGSWRDRPWRTWVEPRLKERLEDARNSSWANLGPADLLVFNHGRHSLHDGGWVCPYSEPLLRALPYSRLVIEQGFQGRHYFPAGTPNVKYIERAKFFGNAAFAAFHGPRGGFLTSPERRACAGWAAQIRQRFGVGPDPARAVKLVRAAVRHSVVLGGLCDRLLDRVQPRAVVLVCHYNARNLALTARARARGIPVVELQHGFIGHTHLAYNLGPGRSPLSFPDYLLLFGRWWREITPGLPLPAERTPSIGYAWLEDACARDHRRKAPGPQMILFISQGPFGDRLSRVAVDLAGRLNPARYRIHYRLHPSEMNSWRDRYPWLVGAPLEVHDRLDEDIFSLLSRARVQVGAYSTALFEGIAFGLQTFVVTIDGHQDVQNRLSPGSAVLVSDATEIATALAGGTQAPADDDISAVWRPGARRNARTFFEDLIGAQTPNTTHRKRDDAC